MAKAFLTEEEFIKEILAIIEPEEGEKPNRAALFKQVKAANDSLNQKRPTRFGTTMPPPQVK